MATYEQISFVEQDLYNALNDFRRVIMSDDFKNIMQTARTYEQEKQMPDNILRLEHYEMMTRLYTYAINKIPLCVAKKLIMNDFKYESPIIAQRLANEIYDEHRHRLRPQKIYAAHMMKKAGLTNKKIAVILETTTATVTKFLKLPIDIK